jgi:hypothetical protein
MGSPIPWASAPGLVLDELRRAALADEHGLRPEALVRVAHRLDDQVRRVAAQVARLEGGVRDRRAAVAPLDHREEQVGVRVALRGVQHVVHVAHGRGDAHRAHVRRPFVRPERQLHDEGRAGVRR